MMHLDWNPHRYFECRSPFWAVQRKRFRAGHVTTTTRVPSCVIRSTQQPKAYSGRAKQAVCGKSLQLDAVTGGVGNQDGSTPPTKLY